MNSESSLLLSLFTNKWALICLGIVVAVIAGVAVPSQGPLMFGWLLLPVGGLLLLNYPILGLYLLVSIIPLENLAMIGEDITASRLIGMGVFGVWVARKLLDRESWRPVLAPGVFKIVAIFAAFAFISSLWAMDVEEVQDGLISLAQMLLLSLLVADLIKSWSQLAWIARGLVMVISIIAILTIQQYLTGQVRRAGGDIAGTENGTAYVMVIAVPFAIYLVRAQGSQFWRLLGLCYTVLAIVGVALTFSRTSFVLLTLVILANYWKIIREGGGRGWLILLSGVAVIGITFIPRDLIIERVESIGPYIQSALSKNTSDEDSSRGYIYRVGLAVFREHPFGVGYNNFGYAYREYQYKVPGATFYRLNADRSPHSSYLGLLTELGLPGFILWLAILGFALRNLIIAWSIMSKAKQSAHYYLVQAITYNVFLQVGGYAFARNIHLQKLFWLLLALSVVVRNLAEQNKQETEIKAYHPNIEPAPQLSIRALGYQYSNKGNLD
jgi:O-antigen ligase